MTLAHAAFGFFVLVLVVTGVAGTVYKVMSPDGWIAQLFGRSTSAGMAVLGSLALVLALAWFSRDWAPTRRNRYADLFVYAFSAAGLLYLGKYWLQGSF